MSNRHDELSEKLYNIGFSLLEEGEGNGDYITGRIGEFVLLIGGIIQNEDDVELFGELCSMFSAKKILDNQMESGLMIGDTKLEIDELINRMKSNIDDNEEDDLDTDLDDELE